MRRYHTPMSLRGVGGYALSAFIMREPARVTIFCRDARESAFMLPLLG